MFPLLTIGALLLPFTPICHGKIDLKLEDQAPCQACKTVVKTFKKGMSDTNKGHFGGGDTAWEEAKLGDYAKSETRLTEIQEQLCSEIERGQRQCYKLIEEWEPLLEEWWSDQRSDLMEWLCIEKVGYCCKEGHYGPECRPCPGHPGAICSSNGKCRGDGTRKGNGTCNCNYGYRGELCNECDDHFYEAYRGEKLLCVKCYKGCKSPCTKAGATGCIDCQPGWIYDENRGCLDVDECASSSNPCSQNQFCVNREGSYSCLDCDPACARCYGDGPDMCVTCAHNYTLEDGFCKPVKVLSAADWTRYLTYLGLCIATCIVFQKNTVVASFIGVLVAIYVSLSEYMMSSFSQQSPESRGSTPLFEALLKKFQ